MNLFSYFCLMKNREQYATISAESPSVKPWRFANSMNQ